MSGTPIRAMTTPAATPLTRRDEQTSKKDGGGFVGICHIIARIHERTFACRSSRLAIEPRAHDYVSRIGAWVFRRRINNAKNLQPPRWTKSCRRCGPPQETRRH